MYKAYGVLIAEQRVQPTLPAPGPAPRLRLLIELEPRYRVFFRNLTDLLLSRRVPPIFISARPAPFWNDVFVGSGAGWASFAESMLGHLLLIIVLVWSQSKVWAPVKLFQQRDAVSRSIAYTPPRSSFRAEEGRTSNVRASAKHIATHHGSTRRQPIAVRPEQRPGMVTPPDIKQPTAGLPDLPGSHTVTPMVPFSATARLRQNALVAPSGVVGPAPQVNQATSRRMAMPQASAIAPAPELGGPPVGRTVNAAALRVVEPPPSVQNAGGAGGARRLRSLSGTGSDVVPPPPLVQDAGAGNARLGSMVGASSQVVPPAPSVQASGGLGGGARSVLGMGNSGVSGHLSGDGSQVIPPPPSAERASSFGTHGHFSSLSGDGAQIVPPPPSVEGTGSSAADGRLGSLSGNGSQIIPPPPTVGGADNSGTGRRTGLLSGGSSEIVPPAPSVEGAGNSSARGPLGSVSGGGSQIVPPPPLVAGGGGFGAGGRASSLLGDGSPVVPPPPSVEGTGSNSGTGGMAKAMDPAPVVSTSASSAPTSVPAANKEITPTIEELPLGLLGLVFAPPGTSFFANFEVFVAKRRVGRDQLQLIKLVYEFLPYQRRLSEYDLNSLPRRVVRLQVTQDPSCNESLGRMIEPHTDSTLSTRKYPELPPELRSSDLDAMLPCYRTNAEDFRKAMARAR